MIEPTSKRELWGRGEGESESRKGTRTDNEEECTVPADTGFESNCT